jgi:hypothetical protein
MPTIIYKNNSRLESFYEERLDYLHNKYHKYPTTLNYGPMTEAEKARISYYDAHGRDCAARPLPDGFHPGKDVA